jgi:hypothetical protein
MNHLQRVSLQLCEFVQRLEALITKLLITHRNCTESQFEYHILIKFRQLIQARGDALYYEMNKYINFVWNKEELPEKFFVAPWQWMESIIEFTYKNCEETDFNS